MPESELPDPHELREHSIDVFARRIALVTAIYAVVLALAALGGNHAMREMLLAQQKSSDQWAFYQAKVIREHQYRGQKQRLEIDLAERGATMKPEAREKLEALLKKSDEEEQRYNAEKKDVEREARKLEHDRDLYQVKDPYFMFAEALLQIAVVMSSVAILSKSRSAFSVSLVLGVGGAIMALNGHYLFFQLPFLHGGH
jgi:hypothetical protein